MNLALISKNRSSIYGIAMLWIMLCHTSFTFNKPWMLPILVAKNMGNCGVDEFYLFQVFLFIFHLKITVH